MEMVNITALPGGKNISGIVTILEVSRGSLIVGHGFIIWDWITNLQGNPILSTLGGRPLPMGQFDVGVVEERLAVINFNIH